MKSEILVKDNIALVSSEVVAKKFGKVHRDVMEILKRIKSCDDGDFWRVNFHTSKYEVRGKEYDCYLMTKDGFAMLAMGFTGIDAMSWKISYISAFNKMESYINKESHTLTDKINKVSIEIDGIKEAGSAWGLNGVEIKAAKKKSINELKALMDHAQFSLGFTSEVK